MKKITDYGKINHLMNQIGIEKVYPHSILEGFQSGEIFVDDAETIVINAIPIEEAGRLGKSIT